MIVGETHHHRTKWSVPNPSGGVWHFCECGCVHFNSTWHTLDNAWRASKGAWRRWFLRFLQAHDVVVREIHSDLQKMLVAWATNTTVNGIPEDDFDMWLQDFWSSGPRRTGNASTISIETTDQGVVYHQTISKENDVKFLVHAVRVQAGWVGQIIDESLGGEILWETAPQQDAINDDHEVLKTGIELAKEAAERKLVEVKRELFA